jgi:hypothetical protein
MSARRAKRDRQRQTGWRATCRGRDYHGFAPNATPCERIGVAHIGARPRATSVMTLTADGHRGNGIASIASAALEQISPGVWLGTMMKASLHRRGLRRWSWFADGSERARRSRSSEHTGRVGESRAGGRRARSAVASAPRCPNGAGELGSVALPALREPAGSARFHAFSPGRVNVRHGQRHTSARDCHEEGFLRRRACCVLERSAPRRITSYVARCTRSKSEPRPSTGWTRPPALRVGCPTIVAWR